MRRAFSLIELVFVIVILGILAAISLPRLSAYLETADISNAKSTVTAIRSALQVYKTKHILKGENPYPSTLDSNDSVLFDKVLPTPVTPSTKRGRWSKSSSRYIFHLGEHSIVFNYDSSKGSFVCDPDRSTPEGVCDQF